MLKFLGNKNFCFVEHLEVEHQSVGPKKTTKMIGWKAVSRKMALLGVPSDVEKRVCRKAENYMFGKVIGYIF